ncbi:hypothetical protein PspLS_05910 [Pyricularia sp. CBS 133598]|nr:hypothetical protein PspLS_05910 [Pyricularia sp. CBS 133598]
MGAFEVSFLKTKPGVRADDDSTEAGKLMRNIYELITTQAGAQFGYWGHEIQSPTHMWSFVQWDSVEDQTRWHQNPDYTAMRAKGLPMLDPQPAVFVKHIDVSPLPVVALDTEAAAVTEVLSIYFPASTSSEDKAKISGAFQEFVDKGLEGYHDFKGASMGWGVENDFPLPGNSSDETGGYAVYWAFIGWPSVEADMKFQETDRFKENIGTLLGLPGLVKISSVHVSCKKVARKTN